MSRLREIMQRRRSGRPDADIEEGLLADVEHLAEVVADTIGELHDAGLGYMARRLEAALGRLGRTR